MNKVGKALWLAVALTGATTVAMAQQGKPAEGGKTPVPFAERKQHMLERMDQRIQAMQKSRDCLAQAQDEQAARACRPAHGPRGGMQRGDMGGEHMAAHMAQHMAQHAAEHAQGGEAEHSH